MSKNALLIDHSITCGGGQISLMTFLKLQTSYSFILVINLKNDRLIDFCNEFNIKFYEFDFQKPVILKSFNLLALVKNINSEINLSILYGNTFEGGFWCAFLKLFFKIPFVFRARLAINKFNHGFVDFIIYRFSDVILANSNFVKSSFIERFGYKVENKIKVVYNPAVSDFSKLIKHYKQFKSKEFYKIAIIGNIEENKGQLIAIKAIEYLINRLCIYNVKLLIIGNPDIYDNGKYFNSLKDYAKKANLTFDNLEFLGYVNTPEILYNDIDLVINCHQFEALSRVMFETQLYGIPNIAANAGGNIELITVYKTGLLFEPNNYVDLANKISIILRDKSLYELISYNSNIQTLELFSKKNTLDREEFILNKLYIES
jgi:glycosyltransferase involved in cell wall biosynthesis